MASAVYLPTASDLSRASSDTRRAGSLLSRLERTTEGEVLTTKHKSLIREVRGLMQEATDTIEHGQKQLAHGQGGVYVVKRLEMAKQILECQPTPLRRSKRPVLLQLDGNRMCPPKRPACESSTT